ncbi:MAG: carboxypeptidase-like regulatory domain-containing protein [Candidatus Poribacteria bacterium]|nr:carboxypeptidase-like regulatory domain-containing protein [Candidatus Poribacteria bacterium]
MKSCLFFVLFIGIMIPYSVFAETNTAQEGMPESIRQPISPTTGDVEGTVYSQDTDTPLAAAEVHFTELDVSTKTDASGNFQFIGIAPGTYVLSIMHPTSKTPATVKIEVTAGETKQVKIYVGTTVQLETVLVKGQSLPPTISRKVMRGSELVQIPSAGSDALRAIMTLPGIGVPNDFLRALHIRGSAPGDTRIYVDRTPLSYPFHFGGFFSTTHSDSIENIYVYAAGYGAEFGLDSQSVIDIKTRERLNKQRAGVLDLNFISPYGFFETKIGDKGYASIAGRFTTLDLLLGLFFDWTFPTWSDYQLKFAYQLTEKHHLTLNGIGATDHFDFSDTRSSAYFKNGFQAEGVHLRSHLTDRLTSHLSLTHSYNFLNINLGGDPSQDEASANEKFIYSSVQVNVPTYTLREDLSYELTPKLRLEQGFLFAFSPAESTTHTFLPEIISFDDEKLVWEEKFDTFHYSFQQAEGYLQTRYDPLAFLSIALGVRLDYLNLTEKLSIQPRGSLSLTLPTTSTLRFAYGRYEQSPFAYQVLKTNGNRDLKSSITEHYVVELEHELSPQTQLKFALYYKDMEKLVTRSVNVDALFDNTNTVLTTPYRNQGTGFVNGAEIFLRHRVSEKFFGWFSYAYTHAERRETLNASYKPFLFDNTHIASLVANYSPTPKISIGAKWQYVSGTAAVPLSTLLMIQDPVTLGMHPLLSDVTGALAPAAFQAYHRLDLRLSRQRTQWGIPVTEFIEVWNVYNSQNKINFSFPDNLVTEFKKTDSEEFPLDLETSEYKSPVRFPFNFTFGATYKF